MSCNPAIGGPAAKSHLVRELDALGGEMARVIDSSYLNIRRLNETRGPAVLALRAQADKRLYQAEMTLRLERQPNLTVKQGLVNQILVNAGGVYGVRLQSGREYLGATVILAPGTFLGGAIVMGSVRYAGGRQGEPAALELSRDLQAHGIRLRRFQTATPPRISRRSVDFSRLKAQPLQPAEWGFSWDGLPSDRAQTPCWVTNTTPATIKVIQENMMLSPIRSGAIIGKGPHFCPSIDRKVLNFPEKTDHFIFLEPEGAYTEELYLLGLTTAMPESVQEAILATIPGLEAAEIVRPGYAVEYDCLDSFQFQASLESKLVAKLFTAGQINGTSGYEEAAVQGLVAGVNAARKFKGQEPFIPERTNSYIGVLIDDLVTQGTSEPYRMMTSLAEFRLFLRLDNSLTRLGPIGNGLGLIPAERWLKLQAILDAGVELQTVLGSLKVKADSSLWGRLNQAAPERGFRLRELVMRPEVNDNILLAEFPELKRFPGPIREFVWHEIKLAGYLDRQTAQHAEALALEAKAFPADLLKDRPTGLSDAAYLELAQVQPRTLGQALRIKALAPADRTFLMIHSGNY